MFCWRTHDGVTEARTRSGELYGEVRLRALLESLRGLAPALLPEALAEVLMQFQGDWAADDIALVALTATG